MKRFFKNNNHKVKKSIWFLFFISLFLMGSSLFSCRNWGCLDCNDGRYIPPLHEAAGKGDIRKVERILNEGVDVNDNDNYHKRTALHYASQWGHADVVLFLIRRGANVNQRDSSGMTPLHFAKTVKMAEILLNNRAKITAKDNEGNTPLYFAMPREETKLALFLTNRGGARVNKNEMLRFAVWENEEEVAKLIFEKEKANPYIKNRYGNSAMSIAKERDYQELVQLFETYNSDSSKN